MIYAVNKQTKEHRLYKKGEPTGWGEVLVQVDADGWIEWSGKKECPLPKGALCEIKFKDNAVSNCANPELPRWEHKGSDSDIIAYRPILDQPASEEPPKDCVTVRYDLDAVSVDSDIRKKLIDMGWLPPQDSRAGSEEPKGWKPAAGEPARTSGGDCMVLAVDAKRNQAAVRWHDGELGVVSIEALKKRPTRRDQWIRNAGGIIKNHGFDMPSEDYDYIEVIHDALASGELEMPGVGND